MTVPSGEHLWSYIFVCGCFDGVNDMEPLCVRTEVNIEVSLVKNNQFYTYLSLLNSNVLVFTTPCLQELLLHVDLCVCHRFAQPIACLGFRSQQSSNEVMFYQPLTV